MIEPRSTIAKKLSFTNNNLISSVYLPTDTSFGGPATNQVTDNSVSEDVMSPKSDNSWGMSDSEEDLLASHKRVHLCVCVCVCVWVGGCVYKIATC